MTRFARSKGSKASNERVPEDATPWSEMKKQLLEKNQHGEEAKKKQQADKQREKNYKQFLKEVDEEESRNAKWAEFPEKKKKEKVSNDFGEEVIKPTKRKKSETENEQARRKKKANVLVQQEGEQQSAPEAGGSTNKKRKKLKDACVTNETNNEQPEKKKKLKILSGEVRQQPQVAASETNKNSEEGAVSSRSKFEKRNKKAPKFVAQKKGIKNNKQNNGKFKTVKSEKPVVNTPPSEEDLKKIEKKKQKKIRQLEKKKLKQQDESNSSQTKEKRSKFQNKQKPERRKKPQDKMIINGKEVEIAYVDSFPIKKEDADRIKQLRKQMISKGLPRSEINITLKLERRKAEKALAREKKRVCFNCRKFGHNLSECPSLGNQIAESFGTGICFKCGSTEHTHFECKVVKGQEFKYAQCFICHEQGHIARQCPDNARGLYPKGGACKVCGDVTHLKKDCPKYQIQQQQLEQNLNIGVMNFSDNPDNLDRNDEPVKIKETKRPNKIVKF